MKTPYFTKSAFKRSLECVTQLYYYNNKDLYYNASLDNEFLLALAKGGYQVGELAKFYFCEEPEKELISIDSLDYDDALKKTDEALNRSENVIISEAAFKFKNLFIRVDLLVRNGNEINIYEVKAKSYDSEEKLLKAKGSGVNSKWSEYLYDVAFQRFVVKHALEGQGFNIKTYLLLVNKDAISSIDGLHQNFKVYSEGNKIKVVTKSGVTRKDLGTPILIPVNTDEICDRIESEFPMPSDFKEGISFEEFIWQAAEINFSDEKVITPVGAKCKGCSFLTSTNEASTTKSGFLECWKSAMGLPEINGTLITDLWTGGAGSRSITDELARAGKFYIQSIEESDIAPISFPKKAAIGLTPHLRRMEQINREKQKTNQSYFDADGLASEMDSWNYPLHMIDFETSAVAVPFFKGLRPYEGVAFQFSHHIIDKDWKISHETQFLSFEPGVFPNYEFVRSLKNALSNDDGTIFRYHNHENTYLNMIYWQLNSRTDAPPDKKELMDFIDEITHDNSRNHTGTRDMVDLYKLVLQYYYSPIAKGSNSLKQILPAIIAESEYLKKKYGTAGIYGKGNEIHSLNFDDHIWIKPEYKYNPYKTLPKVFENYDQEILDLLVKDMEEVADGGTAMTAYNYLQFSEIPINQRKRIAESLLKYCELDTLAMVLLLESWKDKIFNR